MSSSVLVLIFLIVLFIHSFFIIFTYAIYFLISNFHFIPMFFSEGFQIIHKVVLRNED